VIPLGAAAGDAPVAFLELGAVAIVLGVLARLAGRLGLPAIYLECGGNYDATAASLSMHRSTLKYRLQRIREISGYDLSDADSRFNLQLATRAWTKLRALGADRS
jgi:hypothetical protein